MWDLGPFPQIPVVYEASDQYPFTVCYKAFKSVQSFLSVTDDEMNCCKEKISLTSGRTF